MADKHDVFVGNLTFNTTEEQLREKFSFVGPVKNIRILTDKETGKPKGFAFVEYFDPNTALAAIRHLDQTELNSRKLKVGYPAQSNLKDLARQIGQVVPESSADGGSGGGGGGHMGASSAATRQQIEQTVINSLKLHEAWDLLDAMKKLVAEDNNRGNKAKAILETHPQLISALYEIQRRLGIALPKNIQQSSQQSSQAQGSTIAAAGADTTRTDNSTASSNNHGSNNHSNSSSIYGNGSTSTVQDSSNSREYNRWEPSRDAYRGDWDRDIRDPRDIRDVSRDPRDVRDSNRDSNRDSSWERSSEWDKPALNLPSSSTGNIRASVGRAHTYHDHPYGNNNSSAGAGAGGGPQFSQLPPLAPQQMGQFRQPPRQQHPQDTYGGGMDSGGYPPSDAQYAYNDYPPPQQDLGGLGAPVTGMPLPERRSRFN